MSPGPSCLSQRRARFIGILGAAVVMLFLPRIYTRRRCPRRRPPLPAFLAVLDPRLDRVEQALHAERYVDHRSIDEESRRAMDSQRTAACDVLLHSLQVDVVRHLGV